jgi:hypothetical protein
MDYYDIRRFYKKTKHKFLMWLKRFLRSIYFLGRTTRIFIAVASGFTIVCLIVIFSVSGSRRKEAVALAEMEAMATPSPTIYATPTIEPTPSPTIEIRIEKGAEGEDVLALQKRLMELGYLAIDEPTSYFGNAPKAAVTLFQRQHELQQDGICGEETMSHGFTRKTRSLTSCSIGAEGAISSPSRNSLWSSDIWATIRWPWVLWHGHRQRGQEISAP